MNPHRFPLKDLTPITLIIYDSVITTLFQACVLDPMLSRLARNEMGSRIVMKNDVGRRC